MHGTPYSGREGTVVEPGQLPLAAIVVLKQSQRLAATRLSRVEAFPALLPHVIAADLTPTGVEERLRLLEFLVTSVPVVRLEFRKDDAIWAPLEMRVRTQQMVDIR